MTQQASAANPHPAPPFILALDVGTSSTRTLLFDALGNTLPQVLAQHPYQLKTSNAGEVSVDPDALVEVVAQTIDEALKMAGPLATHIGAVALDTFWQSLMGVNADNHPLTPLILWEDTRPQAAAAALRQQLDEAAIHARTGARLHSSYWPAKLRWLATEEPETVARVAKWLSFGEYLHLRFLGRSVCSLSMASGTGMLQTRARAWDTELIEVLHVRPEQLPPLGDLHDRLRGLTPAYAARWPVLHTIPWFPAMGDGAAACVGSGGTSVENWSVTIGTSSAMRVVVPPEHATPPISLWLYLLDAKRAVLGGALSEGGNLLVWLDSILVLPALPDAERRVAALPPDGHGLTVLPFIAGERSPGWHAQAHMTISGIQVHTSRADLLRAGMEALAYQLGLLYEQLCQALRGKTAPRMIGSGGALLGSPTMGQIVADTLGAPLSPSRDHEASARGAALLALEALGILPDVAKVPPHLDPPIQPDAARHAVYRKGAERQQKLYQVLMMNPQEKTAPSVPGKEQAMQLGMIGLGRMGANMAQRLIRGGHTVVGYVRHAETVQTLLKEGSISEGALSVPDLIKKLSTPRAIWLMVPAASVDATLDMMIPHLTPGDMVIDGGNSYYHDDLRRAAALQPRGIHYVDVGTSGGVWGLERGYCLMIGGEKEVVQHLDPIFATLAPGRDAAPRTPEREQIGGTAEQGYLHCGPNGAGHFVKMVHNGIEYGVMAAYAEGLNVLRNADIGKRQQEVDAETAPLLDPQYYQYDLNLPDIAEVWRRGSVIGSWLLDLTAHALLKSPDLATFSGRVSDSGEGRWTIAAALDEAVPTPVLSSALFERFSSRSEADYADKLLSAMRFEFGGHLEKGASV